MNTNNKITKFEFDINVFLIKTNYLEFVNCNRNSSDYSSFGS